MFLREDQKQSPDFSKHVIVSWTGSRHIWRHVNTQQSIDTQRNFVQHLQHVDRLLRALANYCKLATLFFTEPVWPATPRAICLRDKSLGNAQPPPAAQARRLFCFVLGRRFSTWFQFRFHPDRQRRPRPATRHSPRRNTNSPAHGKMFNVHDFKLSKSVTGKDLFIAIWKQACTSRRPTAKDHLFIQLTVRRRFICFDVIHKSKKSKVRLYYSAL